MQKHDPRQILIVLCCAFLFFGITTASLGPVLPELAVKTGSSMTAIGGIFSALFLGALAAQIISGPLNDRFGSKWVLIGSLLILTAGIFASTFASSYWLLISIILLAGLGHGSTDLSVNVLLSKAYAEKSVSEMNLLHFFFGLGAFIGPSLVSLSLSKFGSGLPVLWLACAGFILLIPVLARTKTPPVEAQRLTGSVSPSTVYRSSLLWVFGLVLLLSVGIENGLGGWVTTYMDQTTPLNVEQGALVSAGFWGALTIGRLITAALGRRISPQKILLISFVSTLLFGIIFAVGVGNIPISIIGIVMIGFFTGSVYPTVTSMVSYTFKKDAGKAISVCSAMGSIGAMSIPWMQGLLLDQTSASASVWFIAAATLLLLISFMFVQKIYQNHQAAQTES